MWIEIGSLFIGLILGIALRRLVFIGGLIGGIISWIKKSELTGLFFIPFIVGVLVGIFAVAIIKSQEKSIGSQEDSMKYVSMPSKSEMLRVTAMYREMERLRRTSDGKDGGKQQ